MKKPIQNQIDGPRRNVLAWPFPRSTSALVLITVALACFAFSPAARAVLPEPGGGYPNFNTAAGTDALFSLTPAGYANTAMGNAALFSLTNGGQNTAIGFSALYSNTGGQLNTASGARALFANTTGYGNTANGLAALVGNTTGYGNTATGVTALVSNISGNNNVALGYAAGSNINGNNNTALGYAAGAALTTGDNNIDIGNFGVAGEANTIRIGGDTGYGPQTATYIAGIAGVTVTGNPVVIDGSGHLGT